MTPLVFLSIVLGLLLICAVSSLYVAIKIITTLNVNIISKEEEIYSILQCARIQNVDLSTYYKTCTHLTDDEKLKVLADIYKPLGLDISMEEK